jgi:hypothetical protein
MCRGVAVRPCLQAPAAASSSLHKEPLTAQGGPCSAAGNIGKHERNLKLARPLNSVSDCSKCSLQCQQAAFGLVPAICRQGPPQTVGGLSPQTHQLALSAGCTNMVQQTDDATWCVYTVQKSICDSSGWSLQPCKSNKLACICWEGVKIPCLLVFNFPVIIWSHRAADSLRWSLRWLPMPSAF